MARNSSIAPPALCRAGFEHSCWVDFDHLTLRRWTSTPARTWDSYSESVRLIQHQSGHAEYRRCGVPITVVCTRADLMDTVADDFGMKNVWEERTDWIQQVLRTICLSCALFRHSPQCWLMEHRRSRVVPHRFDTTADLHASPDLPPPSLLHHPPTAQPAVRESSSKASLAFPLCTPSERAGSGCVNDPRRLGYLGEDQYLTGRV